MRPDGSGFRSVLAARGSDRGAADRQAVNARFAPSRLRITLGRPTLLLLLLASVHLTSCSREPEGQQLRSTTIAIERQPVVSSVLRTVGYEQERQILEIEFTSGSVYRYYDVPTAEYEGLIAAPSHGRYFNNQIKKGGYRFQRVS